MKTCKKCGHRTAKNLDANGYCVDCSDDLDFIARSSIITYKEAKRNRSPEEFLESSDFKYGKIDPLFTGFSTMILYLVYAFICAKEDYGELVFAGALMKPFIEALIIGILVMLSYATIGIAAKKIWITVAKKFRTIHYLKLFSVFSYFVVPLILAFVIAVKAKI